MQQQSTLTEVPSPTTSYQSIGFIANESYPLLRYLRRNPLLIGGLGLLIGLFGCVVLGYLFYEQEDLQGEKQGVDGLTRGIIRSGTRKAILESLRRIPPSVPTNKVETYWR